jgi:hypothetical protein
MVIINNELTLHTLKLSERDVMGLPKYTYIFTPPLLLLLLLPPISSSRSVLGIVHLFAEGLHIQHGFRQARNKPITVFHAELKRWLHDNNIVVGTVNRSEYVVLFF